MNSWISGSASELMSEGGPLRAHYLVLLMSPSASKTLAAKVRQGYLAHEKTPTPSGPPQGPRHSPTVGS
jgi:hypothetical protein